MESHSHKLHTLVNYALDKCAKKYSQKSKKNHFQRISTFFSFGILALSQEHSDFFALATLTFAHKTQERNSTIISQAFRNQNNIRLFRSSRSITITLTCASSIAKCMADSVSRFAQDVPILCNLPTSTAISVCNCFATDSFSLQCKRLSHDESNSTVKKKVKEKENINGMNWIKWNEKKIYINFDVIVGNVVAICSPQTRNKMKIKFDTRVRASVSRESNRRNTRTNRQKAKQIFFFFVEKQ